MIICLSLIIVVLCLVILYFVFNFIKYRGISDKFLDMLIDSQKEVESQKQLNETLKFHYNFQKAINEQKVVNSVFSQTDLKSLRNLLHPDKHDGSVRCSELFQKVNDLIKKG